MNSSDVVEIINTLLSSGNPIFVNIISIIMIVLIFALCVSTVVDVLKKFKDVTSLTLDKLVGAPKAPTPKTPKRDDVKRRIRMDLVIANVLKEAVKDVNLSRALLFQFHNGTRTKSGMPFEYIVLTHEALGKGRAPSTMSMRSYDIRIFSEGFSEVILDQKTVITSVDKLSQIVKDFCEENGDEYLMATSLTDAMMDDQTIGLLLFTRSYGHNFKETDKEKIEKCADICSGILSATWGSCETCGKQDPKGKKGCPKEKQRENDNADCKDHVPIYDLEPEEK